MQGKRTPVIDGKKVCLGCREDRPLSDYALRSRGSQSYREPRCNPCRRAYFQKRNHSLTDEEHAALTQAGTCSVCGSDGSYSSKGLHVDHCHATGQVRGLLCHRCNVMVGFIEKSDSGLLASVFNYIRARGHE